MAVAALTLGNEPGEFPVGTSNDYRPMFFGNTGITTGGTIRVSHSPVNGSSSVLFSDNGVPTERFDPIPSGLLQPEMVWQLQITLQCERRVPDLEQSLM